MKPAKCLSAISTKLASVPELPHKRELLNSLPKPKEKRGAKPIQDKIEPMVLRSPPIGESILQYDLPIPSNKTQEFISESEMIRKITQYLKMVVSTLKNTFGDIDNDGEKASLKVDEEGISLLVHRYDTSGEKLNAGNS
ncbi:coiled-coil domain-containing protein 7-like [Nannospalax galili]|uniref:coiled-coil domain-containing protein 7-like n=1 Tax=Nannospalax galili TaxID=1026970 RepID=UPI0004ED5CBE|nr:coiled-coil domain-containing protein 7-like [Nannospalax galili]